MGKIADEVFAALGREPKVLSPEQEEVLDRVISERVASTGEDRVTAIQSIAANLKGKGTPSGSPGQDPGQESE